MTAHVVPIRNHFGQLTAFVASSDVRIAGGAVPPFAASGNPDGGRVGALRATAVPFDLNASFLMVEDHFPVGFPEGEV